MQTDVKHHPVTRTAQRRGVQRALRAASGHQPDYWAFATSARARGSEPVFQYPAMMVSPMQGTLLDCVRAHTEGPATVYDPFVGSGTTMIEARTRGLAFVGQDINPLAILLCRVETAEAAGFELQTAAEEVQRTAAGLRVTATAAQEQWCEKWFREDVAVALTALRDAIRQQPEPAVRRFLWATLAEVVRRVGNQRLSTPKLQTRPEAELSRTLAPVELFAQLAARNAGIVHERAASLPADTPPVDLVLGDVRDPVSFPGVRPNVVLTSPPYGDNHTTMPYGQASWLPLKWIDLADIDQTAAQSPTAAMRGMDTASLGGSVVVDRDVLAAVTARSPTLRRRLDDLQPSFKAWRRVARFFCDVDTALGAIVDRCQPDAFFVMTLGDRTVAARPVPTTAVMTELLMSRGAEPCGTVERAIPHGRRIAARNEHGKTIGAETVLLMQLS